MLGALLVAVAMLTVNSSALTTIQIKNIKTEVLSVPVPEMPAKAAELVKLSEKKDRQATALVAVRTVVAKHRAAAPLVVSAISKVAPELTTVVAKATAEVAPDQAPSIVAAAVAAAPAQANTIRAQVPTTTTVTRGSASPPASGGTVTISDQPISPTGGTGGSFPSAPPTPANDPRVIYNQPPN